MPGSHTDDRARVVLDASPSPTLLVDPDGVVLGANAALLALVGAGAGEVVGRPALRLVLPDDRALAASQRARLRAGQEAGSFACRVVVADGPPRWTRWTWRRHEDDAGVYLGVHVADVDATARTALLHDDLLAAVAEERATLAAALEATPEGMSVFQAERDASGEVVAARLVRINRAGAGGNRVEDLVGRDLCEFFPEAEETGLLDAVLGTLRTGREHRLVVDVGRHEGWPGSYENVIVPIDADRVLCVFRDVSQAREDAQRLLHAATHDALTGLPNRVLLRDRVEHALQRASRENGALAVAFLDLDGFKSINDTLGHHEGDAVLQQVAARLTAAVREEDTVARLGGDEFVLVVEGCRDESDWRPVYERVVQTLARPLVVAGRPFHLRASVGVVFPHPAGTDADAVLGAADIAMYASKGGGKDRYTVFTEQHRREVVDLVALEEDLAGALARGELLLHYQGIMEMTSGDLVGAEALLRWQHPRRGLLLPEVFLPAAEAGGHLVDIGRWVLGTALRAAAERRRRTGADAFVTVNVSAQQLVRADYVTTVCEALAATGVPAELLVVEMTESQVLPSSTSVVGQLRELREHGVQVAVDDFGTGWSSLGHLATLPVDIVKVDRSFLGGVHDPRRAAVLRSAVDMSRALGAVCVVEGVETEAQLDVVRATGARYAQGFLLDRPGPALR